MQAAGSHLAYAAAMHDGTPVQGLPDGMHGRTLAWDSPTDGLAIGPDGASPTCDTDALHSPCACQAGASAHVFLAAMHCAVPQRLCGVPSLSTVGSSISMRITAGMVMLGPRRASDGSSRMGSETPRDAQEVAKEGDCSTHLVPLCLCWMLE